MSQSALGHTIIDKKDIRPEERRNHVAEKANWQGGRGWKNLWWRYSRQPTVKEPATFGQLRPLEASSARAEIR